jgi:hypothetical protein
MKLNISNPPLARLIPDTRGIVIRAGAEAVEYHPRFSSRG